MTMNHSTSPNSVRAIYEEVSNGSSKVGRIVDPLNDDAWIQSTLTMPVGTYTTE